MYNFEIGQAENRVNGPSLYKTIGLNATGRKLSRLLIWTYFIQMRSVLFKKCKFSNNIQQLDLSYIIRINSTDQTEYYYSKYLNAKKKCRQLFQQSNFIFIVIIINSNLLSTLKLKMLC